MTPIIIFLSLLAILTLFLHWGKSFVSATKLPPHPPGLPILGNLPQLGSLTHQSLCSLSKKYGPLMLLHLGGGAPTVVISSAEIAEQVMKVQDLIFASRPPSSIIDRLFYNSTDVAFCPYNDYWRQKKKICIVQLLSSKCVQSFAHVRMEEVALLIADIRAVSSPSSTVNLSKRLVTLANDIISRVVLGTKFSGERGYREMILEFVQLLGAFSAADFVPFLGGWIDVLTGLDKRVRRTSGELDEFLEQILKMRLMNRTASKSINGTDEDGVDFVDVLLSLRDRHDASDTATPLQMDHIKALILDMFAAGTDTTFTTLEWAMAELIKNPTIMHQVQREIREVVGSKILVEEEDINKLVYLKAVIKESLRLHVPVPLLIPRVATENTTLQGYTIPSGTRIMINAWAIARDSKYWDKPEEFLPERFINSNVDFRGQHFQFTPFGSGRRICPGIGFGIAVIECALANLLYHFDWEVPEEMKADVLDMTESPGITVHKKSALVLIPNLCPVSSFYQEKY